ncbi:MAG: ribosome biogenesis GTPase Der [Candidatus Marinimicrobia bacterium]|nr:ribosome biogenesis GTPase Der [Candidatus Neomarinimicrobiota bacterium]
MKETFVSIVGRPNVGKSTLFNKFLGKRKSIVDSQEGITRDRVYGETIWCGHTLNFIDTGGYIPKDLDIFNSEVRKQANEAISESNLILFLVDGKQGITSTDCVLAKAILMTDKPYIFAVNKCDMLDKDNQIHQFHELGLENPFPLSALNGRNSGDLLDLIVKKLNLKLPVSSNEKNDLLKLAIVGMPNVGKSSLTNALLNKNRSIVTSIAGTTRDSIDVPIKWFEKEIVLIDTAGLRKVSKINDQIEYYSSVRTQNAIYRSNIVLVMIDAMKGFTKQDKTIIDEVIFKTKGLIIIVNKWDLIDKNNESMQNFIDEMRYQFKSIDNYPIIFISALTKQRIHKVLETSWAVYNRIINRLSTKKLNDTLKLIIEKNPPSSSKGKSIRIKYVTQVSREPFVIALYLNYPNVIKTEYKRYLENSFRKHFDLLGISVKLSFRKK